MMSSVAKRLEGKVVLITGGASGIGKATVKLFIEHGAKVLIVDVQDELGQSLCNEIGNENTVSYVHCDVTSETDVQNAVDLAVSRYGKLDIMFNNAGIVGDYEPKAIDSDVNNFKKVLDVNVLGCFLGAKHAARVMVPAKTGCILLTSSVAALVYGGTPHAYNVSKHAVAGLTKSLSVELGGHGIRVNCISPYAIATPLVQNLLGGLNRRKLEEMFSRNGVLQGTVLEEVDIARAALFLASDETKYVSGVNLPVDGAYSLSNQTWTNGLLEESNA